MNLADHRQDDYQRVLYDLQKNTNNDQGARSINNVESHCHWINQTFAEKNQKLSILDLGCGIGLYSLTLAKSGHHVVGVDISSYVIKHAKKTVSSNLDCTFIEADILNFQTVELFDLIIFPYSIFNTLPIDDVKSLLGNVLRLLKSGGHFYFEALQYPNEINSEVNIFSNIAHPLYPHSSFTIVDRDWNENNNCVTLTYYSVINTETVKKSYLQLFYYRPKDYEALLSAASFCNIQFPTSVPGTFDNDNLSYMSIIAQKQK